MKSAQYKFINSTYKNSGSLKLKRLALSTFSFLNELSSIIFGNSTTIWMLI